MICTHCNGGRTVVTGGYGDGTPLNEEACPRCEGSGQEPQPPTSGEWSDWYEFYRRTGHDIDEAAALADRDVDKTREEAVHY
jgi:hypothetical protein